MDDAILGEDLYFRIDGGPAQHARVWDRQRFIMSQVDATMKAKPPQKFTLASREDYRGEHAHH